MQPSTYMIKPTLRNEHNVQTYDKIVLDDWSGTGRGSHVEFKDGEVIPLEQGRFLGRGAIGDVFETVVSGYKLAHKRVVVKRKIGDIMKKETEILKKVSSNTHMIQLIGTYTHRQFLGLLLHPVAVCDLHTFFEDVEAWTIHQNSGTRLDQVQQERLTALGFDFPMGNWEFNRASFIYHQIGCLVSAVGYLHSKSIRHKDLKPSNVLLSRDRLWLSDFGSATDFSLLSQSATDNERGTPRYFSPEVAAWKPNGRASDMFSLGCILLEILVLHDRGTLVHIRQNRSSDPSFHANLGKLDAWCTPSTQKVPMLWFHISQEIKLLLAEDPAVRPTARQTFIKLTAYDISYVGDTQASVFGRCCQGSFVNAQEIETRTQRKNAKIRMLQKELRSAVMTMEAKQSEFDKRLSDWDKERMQSQAQTYNMISGREGRRHSNNLALSERALRRKGEYDFPDERFANHRFRQQNFEGQTQNKQSRSYRTMQASKSYDSALKEELLGRYSDEEESEQNIASFRGRSKWRDTSLPRTRRSSYYSGHRRRDLSLDRQRHIPPKRHG